MKVTILASALVGLAAATGVTLGGVYYEQWFDTGCSGPAFLTGSLSDGFCTVFENFPGQSIKLTQTSPCPAGTLPKITVSTTNDCTAQPDWTFDTTGECIDVAIQPQAIHLDCV